MSVNGYGALAPPTSVAGAPSSMTTGEVVTTNADGTVDVRPTNGRATKASVPVIATYAPGLGDRVVLTDLDGDPNTPVVLAVLSVKKPTALTPAPGDLKATAAAAATAGWLLCDGAPVSRATYAALFAAIGTVYGAGNGTTTFALPDLRGRVPIAVGTATGAAGATAHTLGQKGGEETHVIAATELPAVTGSNQSMNTLLGWLSGNQPVPGVDLYRGSGAAHNNMPPYLAVNWLIKT